MLADRERKTSGPPSDAGRIIRAWRRRIGLTQEGLAQALSVTFSTVSRWENGHVRPSKLAWKALEQLAAERGSPLMDNPGADGGR
jgi:putative transcriptional regulator